MKKMYEKPQVYVESFELSQHVAATCQFNFRGSTDENSCYAVGSNPIFGEGKLFTTDANGCGTITIDGFCYYMAGENDPSLLSLHNSY